MPGPIISAEGTRFHIIRMLGAGASGEVFLVQAEGSPEPLALKLLHPSQHQPEDIARFKHEFAMRSRLHHPHLGTVHDFGYARSHARYFFTSEFLDGQPLYVALATANYADCEAVGVQILDALDAVHAAGLVHRDLKGENILLTQREDRWRATLCDFGLALPTATTEHGISGTLPYVAPELLFPGTSAAPSADLYAFGITWYRLLTGHYPCPTDSLAALHAWHQAGHVDTDALHEHGIPAYAIRMVQHLLHTRPAERFSSAAAIIRYLSVQADRAYVVPQRTQRLWTHDGPFVGREALMTELTQPLHQDTTAIFCLRGARGSGRSRILRELRHLAQLRNYRVIHGRGSDTAEMPTPAPNAPPMCLLIDDMHQATNARRQEMAALIASLFTLRMRGVPCPYLFVYTTDLQDPPLTPLTTTTIAVTPLTATDVADFVAQVVGTTSEGPSWAQALYAFSGGLPQLMRAGLQRLATGDHTLPDSIDAFYADWCRAMPAAARDVLGLLAWAQHGVREADLRTMHGALAEDTLAQLDQQQLIRYEATTHTYHPAAGALAESLRQQSSADERRGWCDRLCAWAEAQHPQDVARLADYAQHGSDPQRARASALRAAQAAEAEGALRTAMHYFQLVIATLPPTDAIWVTTQRRLGRLQMLAGDTAAATQRFQMLVAHTAPDDHRARRESCKELAWIARLARDPLTEAQHLDAALAGTPAAPDDPEYLQLMNERGQAHIELEEWDAARQLLTQTQQWTAALPATLQAMIPNNNLGLVLAHDGDTAAAVAFYTSKLERFRTQPRFHLSILSQRALVYQRSGQFAAAYADYLQAWQLALDTGEHHSSLAIGNTLLALAQGQARYRDALMIAEQGLRIMPAHTVASELAQRLLTLALLHINMGCSQIAERYLAAAEEQCMPAHDPLRHAWCLVARAYLQRDQGRTPEAIAIFEQVAAIGQSRADRALQQWGAYGAAECGADTHDLAAAEQYFLQIPAPNHDSPDDDEFALRYQVLDCKLRLARDGATETLLGQLQTLAALAAHQQWRELVWEIAQLQAQCGRSLGRTTQARVALQRAVATLYDIANDLEEEYRDGYLRQRFRAQVIAELPTEHPATINEGDDMLPIEKVLHIAKQLASEHDPERLLALILDDAIEMAGAERGMILLPDGEDFRVAIARNVDKTALQSEHFSKSVASKVASTGEPLMTVDLPHDHAIPTSQSMIALKLQSVACFPLLFKGALRGLIYLDSSRRAQALTPEIVKALHYFADQAAVALSNAELLAASDRARQVAEAALSDTDRSLREAKDQLAELHGVITEAQTRRETRYAYDNIIGNAKPMVQVLHLLDKITATNAPVLIQGETGTGKELIAKAIHFNNSYRKTKRFVAINCAALPDNILESELFGYHKGAFTGADQDRAGLFEAAHEGTLFLDEIGDMSLAMQAKILRAIQEQEVQRLGGKQPIHVDVRIVSASNQDLLQLVAQGQFRQDLYYRIGGLVIPLPTLRERTEDIPLLAQHFLDHATTEHHIRRKLKLSAAALRRLMQHPWPGNVRQLEQVITNAAILAEDTIIGPEELPFPPARSETTAARPGAPAATAPAMPAATSPADTLRYLPTMTLKDYEREIVHHALEHFHGNKSKAAIALGITRMTLQKKVKGYGM